MEYSERQGVPHLRYREQESVAHLSKQQIQLATAHQIERSLPILLITF
jgi:hypothetical protein